MEKEKVGVGSKVYIVQNPKRMNSEQELVNKFDLTPAKKFGELVFLLSANAKPFNPRPIVKELKRKLIDFSDNDYLLAIGNPLLMCWASALAAEANNGKVRMLQWNGSSSKYIIVNAQVLEETKNLLL